MKHYLNENLIFNLLTKTTLCYIFISLNLFAHPHLKKELQAHPHIHSEDGKELYYDLNNFNNLEDYTNLKAPPRQKSNEKKKIILLDDDLYLLNNEFDFGEYEYELEKINLNPNALETAKEYEDLLNAFYNESNFIGQKISTPKSIRTDDIYNPIKEPLNQKSYKYTDAPKDKYELSTYIGLSFPNGLITNQTSSGYSPGPNIGIRLNTPINFKLAKINSRIGLEFYLASLLPQSNAWGFFSYSFISNISLSPIYINNQNLSYIEFRPGIGLTSASINTNKDISLTFPIDIVYHMILYNLEMDIKLQLQFNGGHPIAGTASLINLSCVIKTPFNF